MNNFKGYGPGGLRDRQEYIGGRPESDANYGPRKKSFNKKGGKPSFGKRDGERGGNRGGDRDRRELQMYKATCSSCGKPCEVPFKPDGSKPVLCSECFGKNKSDDRRGGFERRDRAPRPDRGSSQDFSLLVKQVNVLEEKLNEILALLQAAKVVTDEVAEEVAEAAEAKPVKKPRKVAKKAAAPKKVVKKTKK